MNDWTNYSREELVTQLVQRDEQVQILQEQVQQQKELLREQDIQQQLQEQKYNELSEKHETLQLAYDKILKHRFRNLSERYTNENQLTFDFLKEPSEEETAEPDPEPDDGPIKRRRKRRSRRDENLPEHLPRYEVTAEISEDQKNCPDHGERTLLPKSMWDRTETLEFEPPQLKVRVTLYPKYACSGHPSCGIVSPDRPAGLVEGNKFDSSIATEIITAKYGFHLPLYRLQNNFFGGGWTPARSTLCHILTQAHTLLDPLIEYFRSQVQRDSIIGCDDTGLTLLYPKTLPEFDLEDPKQRRTHEVFSSALAEKKSSIRAKMWVYRGMTLGLNIFDFTVSRHRDGPELFFKDYQGTILGDCWHGFESISLSSSGLIARAACVAHARRKIVESSGYPADAAWFLERFQQLYDIEDRGKDMSSSERLQLRHEEAKPIWDLISTRLDESQTRVSNVILPKSDFGKALQYIRNHLSQLRQYLTDGNIPIDNNLAEQLMKQVALGRKNWLFVASVAGGERAASFLTLVSSALRNDLHVWPYIKDVLNYLLSGQTDYSVLLPWNWRAAHPESVLTHRIHERNTRREAQRFKRELRRRLQRTALKLEPTS